METAWLVLAAGEDRQHGGNDGYDDEPAEKYIWDDTVPNHASVSPGDAIVLWDKKRLLGASVIERIHEGSASKIVYRCAECQGAHIKRRKTLDPRWRCFACSTNFDEPIVRSKAVHTYLSRHEAGWVDLDGMLGPADLRALCVSPKSQLSIRPLRWGDFRSAVESVESGIRLTVLDSRAERLRGGHHRGTVRVRRGQGKFRSQLLAAHGHVCAITGPAPSSTLDAGHLYSYADVGEHHAYGGLLLRRDVHRLFDLGLIAVNPKSLLIDVGPEVAEYPSYAALDGQPLAATVNESHRQWLTQHWTEHRGQGGT